MGERNREAPGRLTHRSAPAPRRDGLPAFSPTRPYSGAHAARRFPGRAACTLYHRATSYARLEEQARRLARSLQNMGAGPGRHVAVLLPNMPEHATALQAIWLTGATVLQLSPLMVAEEVS